jgi:hypothetical protein
MLDYLPARDAIEHLPTRPHINTIRRWMFEGVNGIRLKSIRFGGKRLTTEQWCREFVEAVANRGGDFSEHHVAEAQLDQLGVC